MECVFCRTYITIVGLVFGEARYISCHGGRVRAPSFRHRLLPNEAGPPSPPAPHSFEVTYRSSHVERRAKLRAPHTSGSVNTHHESATLRALKANNAIQFFVNCQHWQNCVLLPFCVKFRNNYLVCVCDIRILV